MGKGNKWVIKLAVNTGLMMKVIKDSLNMVENKLHFSIATTITLIIIYHIKTTANNSYKKY